MYSILVVQRSRPDQVPFIRAQQKIICKGTYIGLGAIIEIMCHGYKVLAVVVGFGWEGDRFVVNVTTAPPELRHWVTV